MGGAEEEAGKVAEACRSVAACSATRGREAETYSPSPEVSVGSLPSKVRKNAQTQ